VLVVGELIKKLRALVSRIGTVLSRRDPLGVIVAVAVGVGAFYAVQAIVSGLLLPIVAVFIGDPRFELNSFTINGVEFGYGVAIEYALSFTVTLGLGYAVLSASSGKAATDESEPRRRCPECTMPIPAAATRCPHCTARVQPDRSIAGS